MTQAKRYQGGSIISFIIVTIVIAALLIGGVVWMRHRGTVAREQSTEVATQQNGIQQSSTTYRCLHCHDKWQVNEARTCRLRRTRLTT